MNKIKFKYSLVKIGQERFSICDYTNKKIADSDCKELNKRYGFIEYKIVPYDTART